MALGNKHKEIIFEGKKIEVDSKLGFISDKFVLSIEGREVDSIKIGDIGSKTLRGEYRKSNGEYQQIIVEVSNSLLGIKCNLKVNGQICEMK